MKSKLCVMLAVTLFVISVTPFFMAFAASPAYYSIADIFEEPGLLGYSPENIEWSSNGRYLTFLLRDSESDRANLYIVDTANGKRSLLLSAEQLSGAAASPETIKNERKKERLTRYNISS